MNSVAKNKIHAGSHYFTDKAWQVFPKVALAKMLHHKSPASLHSPKVSFAQVVPGLCISLKKQKKRTSIKRPEKLRSRSTRKALTCKHQKTRRLWILLWVLQRRPLFAAPSPVNSTVSPCQLLILER